MLEEQYLNKQLHLINICEIDSRRNGITVTDLLEVVLVNLETGELIESKYIIKKLLDKNIKNDQISNDNFDIQLKHSYQYIGHTSFGWVTKLFGIKRNKGIRIENEFFLTIKNPIFIPIIIKSIVVETSKFLEVEPRFKNVWTIPSNDDSITLVEHIYKKIKENNCIDNDTILIRPINWKIGNLTDVKGD